MSYHVVEWALTTNVVADTYERIILAQIGRKASDDGTNAFPSQGSLAESIFSGERVVRDILRDLTERGVLRKHPDKSVAVALSSRRPNGKKALPQYLPDVYDVLMPCAEYGETQLAKTNAERQMKGLEPLTPENRPALPPAPSEPGRIVRKREQKKKAEQKKAAKGSNSQGKQTGTGNRSNGESGAAPDRHTGAAPDRHTGAAPDRHTGAAPDRHQVPTNPSGGTGPGESVPSTPGVELSVRPSGAERASDQTDGTDETDNNTNGNNSDRAIRLMAESRTKQLVTALGKPYPRQSTAVREALEHLLTQAEEDQVRGFLHAKLREAKTFKYVIDGLTTYGDDVHEAEPALSPERIAEHQREVNERVAEKSRSGEYRTGKSGQEPGYLPADVAAELASTGKPVFLPKKLQKQLAADQSSTAEVDSDCPASS